MDHESFNEADNESLESLLGSGESAVAADQEMDQEMEWLGEDIAGEVDPEDLFADGEDPGAGEEFGGGSGEAGFDGESVGEDFVGEADLEGLLDEAGPDQFFGTLRKALRRAAPLLKRVARVAAPLAGKAVGGMFGGPAGAMLGSKLGGLVARQIREARFEGLDQELDEQADQEDVEREMSRDLGEQGIEAEALADESARTADPELAAALMGAASKLALGPSSATLRQLAPGLLRGACVLNRVLRLDRRTRPAVRAVPTIVRRTAGTLKRAAANGRPVSAQRAGQVMAAHTRRVLSSPRLSGAVAQRSASIANRIQRRPAGAP